MPELIFILPLFIFFLISLYNLIWAPELKANSFQVSELPLVSVLIPARNEESKITECLNKVLNQDYGSFEVIVLDDHSEDSTFAKAQTFEKMNPHFSIIKGENLPEGWLGKNWACHQLSLKSKGSLLLFIDADVELEEGAIASAVNNFLKSEVALLSVFPTQKIKSFGEWLVVPLMNWLLLSFLPLKKVYTSKKNSLVAANGQFMMWDRKTYFENNYHKLFRNEVVEDMAMAREAKRNNLKIITLLGGELVNCRMYSSFNEAVNGFSKNFFPGFRLNAFLFLIFITVIIALFLIPIFLVSTHSYFLLVLIVLNRMFISIKSRQNLFLNLLLHPLQIALLYYIGIRSILSSKRKSSVWKGRRI